MPSPINMILHATLNGKPVRTIRTTPNPIRGSMISNANSGRTGCTSCGSS